MVNWFWNPLGTAAEEEESKGEVQRLTFPFPFVHHQSHVYQQPRPSGTTINRGNEDWMMRD